MNPTNKMYSIIVLFFLSLGEKNIPEYLKFQLVCAFIGATLKSTVVLLLVRKDC